MNLDDLLRNSSVPPTASLLECISALDKSQVQLALVLDEQGVLLGLLTDGDVRRALLAGHSLDASIDRLYTRDFVRAEEGAGRLEVLDLMQSRLLRHIPVVDPHGRPVAVHCLSEMLVRHERPNSALILAGGKGTRLLPLTRETPKPMLRVAGRPILERILLHLVGHGIRKFFFSVNYLAATIKEYFGDGTRFGCSIAYLEESLPLGTAGPLTLLPEKPKEGILVMNGDLVTQFDASALIQEHQRCGNSLTVATRLYHHKVPFGCLSLEGNLVTNIQEKPVIVETISAGIYMIQPELVEKIPLNTEFPMTSLILDAIEHKQRVGIFELHDEWIDVGQKHDLERAQGGHQ